MVFTQITEGLQLESDVIFYQYKGSEACKLNKINRCYYFFIVRLRLLPVKWVDGWPIIGEDIYGDGIR